MKTVRGGNFSYTRGVSLPIVVSEDTEFIEVNFEQYRPHTVVFDVAPGVSMIFTRCKLVNVTVPDGANIRWCNNAQIETIPTGNPDRPELRLLHECEKCATFVTALRAEIDSGEYVKHGRLDFVKPKARERRLDPAKRAADIAVVETENMDACIKYIPQLSEPVAVAPLSEQDISLPLPPEAVAVEAEKDGWFASLWDRTRKFLGF